MGEDADYEAELEQDRLQATVDNRPPEGVELRQVIAGIHKLLPGARGIMVMAFLSDNTTAVFGDVPRRVAAPAFRRWGRDVMLDKKSTRPR